MTKQEAKNRIEKLKKEINKYRYVYHVLDKSLISDAGLDSLKHELKKLEDEYPEFITLDSPTQRVGGEPLKNFKKITHSQPMLSLEDAFDNEEFKEWILRIKKLLPESASAKELEFFAESKFDGLAISLVYENGILKQAGTRGDGKIGEDVTQNVKTIESVPLKLEVGKEIKFEKFLKGEFEARGEVIISHQTFEKINKEQEKSGEKIYANPRNLAAGSVRQLDPKITASRHLDFYAYDIVTDIGQKSHSDEHNILKILGFKTDGYAKLCRGVKEIEELREHFIKTVRQKINYDIDGIVATVNDNVLFERLGVIGKAPRGAIAFKFAPKEAVTILEDIKVQVGRTGTLTPVAFLKPVKIGGVIVSRATLHNEDEIKRLGLKIGDNVIVGRAGDVIPDVKAVLKNLRSGKEKSFSMPKTCPRCGEKLALEKSGKILRCVNSECPARKREALYHFVSKKGFDIDGLGPKIIDSLLDNGLIEDAADIFNLQEGDLIPIERFAEKSAKNLVIAISKSRKILLTKFIAALGILHIGEETAELLARNFQFPISNFQIKDFIKIFKNASLEKLEEIPDVGPIAAKSVYDWFHDKRQIEFLERLGNADIKIELPKQKIKNQKLKNLTFVFTGELKGITREEAKNKVKELGAKTSENVSKKTDYVVAGAEPGSKYERAKKLGVKILTEQEFLKML